MTARPRIKREPRWERRKEARPEQITAAALALFVERGYAATRLEDVAERAGVSKGTVYLYFENKTELFKAVVREGIVSPLAEARSLIDRHEGSLYELLRHVCLGWWERIGSTPLSGIPKLMIAEARNFPEIAEFYIDEVVEPANAAIRRILERGMASGEFRRVNAAAMVPVISAPLLLLGMWQHSLGCCRPGTMEPSVVLDAHLDALRSALLAPVGGETSS